MARCPHDASYIHRHSPYWSVFKQQDANGPFYPSIPDVACWTTWHRVFATPEDFSPSTYKDYVVKLTAGHRGAGTGTVTIKLIDNDAGNYRSYHNRCNYSTSSTAPDADGRRLSGARRRQDRRHVQIRRRHLHLEHRNRAEMAGSG